MEAKLEVEEVKILRFSLGVTKMDKIRNECVRGRVQLEQFGDRQARLRWFQPGKRRDSGYIKESMLKMEQEDMQRVGVRVGIGQVGGK